MKGWRVGEGGPVRSRARSSFGAFNRAPGARRRSRCFNQVSGAGLERARVTSCLPFACAAETRQAGSAPRSLVLPFAGCVRIARASVPLRAPVRFGGAPVAGSGGRILRPRPRVRLPPRPHPCVLLAHAARTLPRSFPPGRQPISRALFAGRAAPRPAAHLSARAHVDLFARMSAPRAPSGRVHPTSLPQPRSRPRDLSAPRHARTRPSGRVHLTSLPQPRPIQGGEGHPGRSVGRSATPGRDPADRRSVRAHREWRALLAGSKIPSIFDRYRGRTPTCAVHRHQGDEAQAGPGRRERSVPMSTRATEDADMRRPSSPWSLLPLDLSLRPPTAIVRAWRKGRPPPRDA
jgi:hypothetical protein